MNDVARGRLIIGAALRAPAIGISAMTLIAAMASPACAQQAPATRTFTIPAQPLLLALQQFTEQSGIQVGFSTELGSGVQSPGVSGTMTPAEALSRLLAGTGLTYRYTSANAVTLEAAPSAEGTIQLGPVRVEASDTRGGDMASAEESLSPGGYVARRSRGATKIDTPLRETPQAVSVVTRQQMEDQGVNTVSEALRYTPGVFSESNGYDIRYDWLYLRGFNTYGTIWLDNLALPGDPSNYATPSFNPYALERIDILKGPASVLYGRTIPGGLINYVSKRPQAASHHEIEIGTSSFGGAQVSADTTGPLTRDGALSYRLVGQWRDMGTQVDSERDRQVMVAPSLNWSPDQDTSITLYGYYQRDRPKNFSPRFYPAVGTLLPNSLGQIPRDIYVGNSGANELKRDFYVAGYEFSHRFNDTLSFRSNARYGHAKQNMFFVLINPAFAYRTDGHTLNRVSAASDDRLDNFAIDNQFEARFATGPLQHTLIFGLDYLHSRSDRNFGNSSTGVPTLDYLNPSYVEAAIPYPAYSTSVLQRQDQLGFYAQDQVHVGRWLGTFSLRYDRSDIRTTNRIAASRPTVATRDSKLTGRVGLTYLFNNGLAPYVSYSTSFLPALGTDPDGNPYKAQLAKQVEAGLKYEPIGGQGMVTFSLFNLNFKNALTPAYLSGTQIGYAQTGEQRVRGVEFEGKYEITPEIVLMAAYAYSDSKITKSNSAVDIGREVLRLPKHQANAWANIRPGFAQGLSLNGGVRITSSYQTDSAYLAQLRIPARTLVDLGAGYDFGKLSGSLEGLQLRVNATNLFDKVYVSHCLNIAGGSCNYGAGRTVTAALKYSF